MSRSEQRFTVYCLETVRLLRLNANRSPFLKNSKIINSLQSNSGESFLSMHHSFDSCALNCKSSYSSIYHTLPVLGLSRYWICVKLLYQSWQTSLGIDSISLRSNDSHVIFRIRGSVRMICTNITSLKRITIEHQHVLKHIKWSLINDYVTVTINRYEYEGFQKLCLSFIRRKNEWYT